MDKSSLTSIWRTSRGSNEARVLFFYRPRREAALAEKVLVIDVSNPIARRDGAELVKWVDDHGGAGLATAKFLGPHVVRAFNAIGYAKLSTHAHRQGELVGIPIAGDDAQAIDIASSLIREIGFDPVVIGDWRWANIWFPERRSVASIRRQKSGRSRLHHLTQRATRHFHRRHSQPDGICFIHSAAVSGGYFLRW
jgi:hypothetical protein